MLLPPIALFNIESDAGFRSGGDCLKLTKMSASLIVVLDTSCLMNSMNARNPIGFTAEAPGWQLDNKLIVYFIKMKDEGR